MRAMFTACGSNTDQTDPCATSSTFPWSLLSVNKHLRPAANAYVLEEVLECLPCISTVCSSVTGLPNVTVPSMTDAFDRGCQHK